MRMRQGALATVVIMALWTLAQAQTVTRTLPATYTPGVGVPVSVAVTPSGGTMAYTVVDTPPAGWTVSSVSSGGAFDAMSAGVQWGPFMDSAARTLTYTATPPVSATGVQAFSGAANFDGTIVATGGAQTIASGVATTTLAGATTTTLVGATTTSMCPGTTTTECPETTATSTSTTGESTTTTASGSTTTTTGGSTTTTSSGATTTVTAAPTTTTLAPGVGSAPGIVRSSAGGDTFVMDTNNNFQLNIGTDRIVGFGNFGDIPLVGDWGGTGIKQAGIYRNGIWVLDLNGNGIFDAGDRVFVLGDAGDRPIVGRWTADADKIGLVRRVGNDLLWILDNNGDGVFDTGDTVTAFGSANDMPIVGDWNGDGRSKIGVLRTASNGDLIWIVDYNGSGAWDGPGVDRLFAFGVQGDLPVAGDWNGDGKDKAGIFRNGMWALDINGNEQWDNTDALYLRSFGQNGDRPIAGHWAAGSLFGAPAKPAPVAAPAAPAKLQADFTASPLSGAVSLDVAFTDCSTGASAWAWDFGDGSTSQEKNPTNVYLKAGAYTVTLTVQGAAGTATETKKAYITVE